MTNSRANAGTDPARRRLLAAAPALLPAGWPIAARAQAYPSRPVKLVVPFPAGSSTDVVGREIAQVLSQGLGKPFFVDNRPGAQATVGSAEVARSPADGYTLLIGTSTSHAAASSLFRQIPYDAARDFTPIARIAAVVFVVVVPADAKAASLPELMRLARGAGTPMRWGFANSANQVAGSAIAKAGGFDHVAVPYRGVPQLLVDMIAGQLDYAVVDIASALPHVRGSKLRALAVTSSREVVQMPGVPPMSATLPEFQLLGWYALYGPAGLPPEIAASLGATLLAGLADPAVRKRIEGANLTVFPADGETLRRFMASEEQAWRRYVRDAGVEVQ